MIVEALRKVVERQSLTENEAADVMRVIVRGDATHSQIGALIAALRTKRETVDELTGFATVMREHAIKVTSRRRQLMDTCGTGGDYCQTFNISTAVAFVLASAGVPVAKHGNRAVSGKCGSADVLAALGVDLALTPDEVGKCIDEVGIGFMYAPSHHPAMKHASQARKELGIRSVFNALGPLVNPANPSRQLIGVFDVDLCPVMAETLNRLGLERAAVVHGMDGLDEVSTTGPTRISLLQHGRVTTETYTPAEFHVLPAKMEDLKGGDTPQENAQMVMGVLHGEHGPRRDIVAVNASVAFVVAGYVENFRDGVTLAHSMLDRKVALGTLRKLVEFTSSLTQSAG